MFPFLLSSLGNEYKSDYTREIRGVDDENVSITYGEIERFKKRIHNLPFLIVKVSERQQ